MKEEIPTWRSRDYPAEPGDTGEEASEWRSHRRFAKGRYWSTMAVRAALLLGAVLGLLLAADLIGGIWPFSNPGPDSDREGALVASLEKQVENLSTERAQLTALLQEERDRTASLKSENEGLGELRRSAENERDAARRDLRTTSTERDAAQRDLRATASKLSATEKERDVAAEELEKTVGQLTALEKERDAARRDLDKAEKDRNAAREALDTAETKRKDTKEELDEAKAKLRWATAALKDLCNIDANRSRNRCKNLPEKLPD